MVSSNHNLSNEFAQIKDALTEHVTISDQQVKRFFKTSPGSYGAHDVFAGITIPNLRKIAKTFQNASLDTIAELLQSSINEERLLALILMVQKYKKGSNTEREQLFQFYLENIKQVNNWNLVDSSAHLIIGAHIWDKDRNLLTKLAASEILWERRIAIISTWYFIRNNDLDWTFKIATMLLNDKEDLIHKAVGWMLREAGKRNLDSLIKFLDNYAATMPRTALRYSLEKLPKTDPRKIDLLSRTSNNHASN